MTLKYSVCVNCCVYVLFKDPTVTAWSPQKGPCSGGTLVVVTGSDLHYGSTLKVMMNRHVLAPVVR